MTRSRSGAIVNVRADAMLVMAKARIARARSGLRAKRLAEWYSKLILLDDRQSADELTLWFSERYESPCKLCGCPVHTYCGAEKLREVIK